MNRTIKRAKGKNAENLESSPSTPSKDNSLTDVETAKLVLNSLTDNLGDPPTTFFDLSSEDIMSVQSLEMIQATSILETTYKKN